MPACTEAIAKSVLGGVRSDYRCGRAVQSLSHLPTSMAPRNAVTEGGIYPVIVGSHSLLCLDRGPRAAPRHHGRIYLAEFAPRTRRRSDLRSPTWPAFRRSCGRLVALFVIQFGLGRSIISGARHSRA